MVLVLIPGKGGGDGGVVPDVGDVEDLAGGENMVGIEGVLDGEHGVDFRRGVLEAQEGGLGDADAVLAGDGAAEGDDFFHHEPDAFLGAESLDGVVAVIHDVDVEVAVGGVPEGGGGQVCARVNFAGVLDQGDVGVEGDDNVFVELGIAELIHGLGTGATGVPESFGLGWVGSFTPGWRVPARPGAEVRDVVGEGAGGAVDLNEEDGGGCAGAGLGEDGGVGAVLGAGDGLGVEKFEDGGRPVLGEERDSGFERVLVGGECQKKGVPGLGAGDEFEGGMCDDTEGSFGADPEVFHVVAAGVFAQGAAPADEPAGREESFEGIDVVTADSVFGGTQAAGVGGDVAANGAIFHGGRVRGVKESVGGGGGVYVGGDGAGLDVGERGGGVHGDARPVGEAEHPAAVDRGGGPGAARAGAADGDGDVVSVRELQRGGDVGLGARVDDGVGGEGDARVVK